MIKISKQNNSLIVEGIDNVFYPNNGDNSYPLNSLIVVTDNSEMATFRSVATNDVLFSGLIKDITINGEAVTKDNIIAKFDAVSNGGTVDAYTKEEADTKFASKDELTNVQTVANDADTKVDALTPRVESVETTLGNKQDTLVSGTNIKTINNQSILGEGNLEVSGDVDLTNYYTKTEADEIFATVTEINNQAADISALQTAMDGKQATLVSGENIKTINSESILGTGDIQINAGAKIVKIGDSPFNSFYSLLSDAVSALNNGTDYTKTWFTMNETIGEQYVDFFKTLKNGDLLSYYGTITGDIFKVECNPFYFEPNKANASSASFDIPIKYLGNFNKQNFINYTRDIYVHLYFYRSSNTGEIGQFELKVYTKKAGPSLQKNDFKTINGESLIGEGNIEVAKKTDIPSTDNLATKDELTAVETVANNADAKADAATSRVESVEASLGNKQDTLVSGTNIKTINSQSIIGSGDLTISGVSEEQAQEIAKIPTIETEIAQKANVSDVPTVQTKQTGGTDKNYIYSDYNHKNKLVFSKFLFRAYSTSFSMEAYPWGENEGYVETYKLPLATTTAAGVMSAADKTKLDSMSNEWTGTQAEYDALTTKDNNTIYYVTE